MRKVKDRLNRFTARFRPSPRPIAEHTTASTSALSPGVPGHNTTSLRPVPAGEYHSPTFRDPPSAGTSLGQTQVARLPPPVVSGESDEQNAATSPTTSQVTVPHLVVSSPGDQAGIQAGTPTTLGSQDPNYPLPPTPASPSGQGVSVTDKTTNPTTRTHCNDPVVVQAPSRVLTTPENISTVATSATAVPATPRNITSSSQVSLHTPRYSPYGADFGAPQSNTSTGTSLPGTKATEHSLWEQAFNKLSEGDKQAFPFTDTDRLDYIEGILEATKKSREACQEKKLKFRIGDKNIIVRDVADKVVTWVEKFKSVGDCAVQYDPVHAALPWAGVRLLLQIAVNNKETMEVVLIGVERVTRLLVRCAIYESVYLQGLGLAITENLEGAIEELYCAILEFLAFAKRYLDKPSAKRVFHGLLDVDGKSCFDSIDSRESLLKNEVVAAEAEMQRCEHRATSGQNQRIMDILGEMNKPISRIDLNIGLVHDEIKDYIQGSERSEILQWISKIEYEKHHKNARERLLESTGQWLLSSTEFCEWQSSSASSILWLHGIPGAGKTKLVCAVIDFLKSMLSRHEPVVYFYCNRNEPERRDPAIIMQAIVKQLSTAHHAIPKPVIEIYNQRKEDGLAAGSLEFEESCETTLALLDLYPQTTVVIDALDESDPDERWRLLQELKSIIHSSGSLVKIFISSRDDLDIKMELEKVPNLYIEARNTSSDIGRFVHREVGLAINNRRLLRGNVSEGLKNEIISVIVGKSDGMFQWAALQITHLCHMKLESDIKNGLGKLPKTLEEAYNQTFDDMLLEGPCAQKATSRAFMWIMCAREPLNQEGWAEASYWPDPVPTGGVDTLFQLCRNLVTWDKELDRVIFVHLSVREYLEKNKFSRASADYMAAESCLSFLLDPAPWPETSEWTNKLLKGSLLLYSSVFWAEHIQYLHDQAMCKQLLGLLEPFLGTATKPGQAYCRWLEYASGIPKCNHWTRPSWSNDIRDAVKYLKSSPPNPLFAISYFNVGEELIKRWELSDADINAKNGNGESSLLLAVIRGNERAMDVLLEKGADVNVGNIKHATNPLVMAIRKGQVKALVRLLDAGSKLSAYHGRYHNILQAVAHEGNRHIAEEVMASGVGHEITEAVLVAAATNFPNSEGVLEFLLSQDKTVAVTEAVLEAAVGNNRNSVKAIEDLISRGGGGNITEAVLLAAARDRGGMEIMKLLLSAGDIEVTETVLVEALESPNFNMGVLEVFLDGGANTRVTEVVVCAAAAQLFYGIDAMRVLLATDANIQITGAVLDSVSENYNEGEQIMNFLLNSGHQVDVAEETLVEILWWGNISNKTFLALLARSPRIEITGAIFEAVFEEWQNAKELVPALLERSHDTKITERNLALIALQADGEELLKLCLDRDPNTKITERILRAAARNPNGKRIMGALMPTCVGIGINDAIVGELARNPNGMQILDYLISSGARVEITGGAMVQAAGGPSSKSMRGFLSSMNTNITISEDILLKVVKGGEESIEVMEFLISRLDDIKITEAVLLASLRSRRKPLALMKYLLSRFDDIEVTEAVLVAAAENLHQPKEVMELLIPKLGDHKPTEAVLVAAANNTRYAMEVLKLLLSRYTDLKITVAVLSAVAANVGGGKLLGMDVLLARYADTEIAEAVLVAAAGNAHSQGALQYLMSGDQDFVITEAVLVAAAGSNYRLLRFLMLVEGDIEVTEALLVGAAGSHDGTDALMFLMWRCGSIEITEAVLVAAAGNGRGSGMLRVLFSRGANIEITEAVLVAAAGCWAGRTGAMEFLMSRSARTHITEAVIVGALKGGDPARMVKFLTSRGANIEITETVVAAAATKWNGHQAISFLLSRKSDFKVTEPLLLAAASGASKPLLQLLLDQDPNIDISEALMVAAAGNESSKGFIKLLLARAPSICVTTAMRDAAVGNTRCGKMIMRLLIARDAELAARDCTEKIQPSLDPGDARLAELTIHEAANPR